jgi:hypothetical protein
MVSAAEMIGMEKARSDSARTRARDFNAFRFMGFPPWEGAAGRRLPAELSDGKSCICIVSDVTYIVNTNPKM